jgi:hypothetical protein
MALYKLEKLKEAVEYAFCICARFVGSVFIRISQTILSRDQNMNFWVSMRGCACH